MPTYIPRLSKLRKYDRRFIWRAIIAFLVALLAILALQLVGYFIQRAQMSRERDTAIIVSASGNQRMLSQRVTLLALALINAHSDSTRERAQTALGSEILKMELNQRALIAGDPDAGIRAEKSAEVRRILFDDPISLDRKVREFIATARTVAESPVGSRSAANPWLYELTEKSTELSRLFEILTSEYQREGIEGIHGLELLATELLLAQLVLLFGCGALIFYPITRRLTVEFYERNVAQSELLEQNKELEQFAAIVAHDLKAPLSNIGGFSQFLRSRLVSQEDKETNEILDSIEAGVRRMTQMINELLHYARLTRKDHPFELISLEEIVNKVRIDFQKKIEDENAQLQIKSLPKIFGDRIQIEHLFMSAFSNALKYRHPLRDPRITISSLGDAHDEDLITIVVEDNGRGFQMELSRGCLSPFRRLSATESIEGSGFGLALCRKIVRRHHGTISAEHSPTGGARFLISLPFR